MKCWKGPEPWVPAHPIFWLYKYETKEISLRSHCWSWAELRSGLGLLTSTQHSQQQPSSGLGFPFDFHLSSKAWNPWSQPSLSFLVPQRGDLLPLEIALLSLSSLCLLYLVMGQLNVVWERYLQKALSYSFIDLTQGVVYRWCSVKVWKIIEFIWIFITCRLI